MAEQKHNITVERPPVIVITGHIDHGKSSLLDYIRKTNVVAGEKGGITQHTSAYEVTHKNENGVSKKITFLDTPGHEAFSKMRARGVSAADIAILVVSAEDSVKAQTIEALKTIQADGLPFIVAINKIDKPAANIEKVKMDLAENGVYVEGFGGNTSCVPISAKTGQGVPELLDTILLVAEMEELKGAPDAPAEGFIIESNVDKQRGISATLLIKNGTLKNGMFVVAEDAVVPARLIENFMGQSVKEACFSSPVTITGWSKLPNVGARFAVYEKKKDAETAISSSKESAQSIKHKKLAEEQPAEGTIIIPLIIKADVAGTLEAIENEIGKIKKEGIAARVVQRGCGAITETDVKLASGMDGAIIIGFNVKAEKSALELASTLNVRINCFDIIYKITEWLEEEVEKQRPRVTAEETTGSAKIMRCFSKTKDKQVVGGKVTKGSILSNSNLKIMRRDFEIGRGKIVELQQSKAKAREVGEGLEFGVSIETRTEIAPGDMIEAYVDVTK
ncbi:MAG: translation initiation factor IF-2 [Candidatus Paceibacterota bacterium]|jgi:translation initiation factor IF-2